MAFNLSADPTLSSALKARNGLVREPGEDAVSEHANESAKRLTMHVSTEPAQALLEITLAYSPAPRIVHELVLTLPEGSKLRDALIASADDARFADLQAATTFEWGVWGRKASLAQTLHDLDRVEAYRPLRVDPKVARRERFAKQGARTSGLFAKRRPGAKPGY